jgi:hypothetical protein
MLIILNILSQNDGVTLKLFQAKCTLHKAHAEWQARQSARLYNVYVFVHVPVHCYKGQDVPPRHKTEALYHFSHTALAPNFIFCLEQFRNPEMHTL